MHMKKVKVHRSWIKYLILAVLFFFAGHRFVFYSHGWIEHGSSYLLYPFLVLQSKVVDPIKVWFNTRKTYAELKTLLDQAQKERDELRAENIALRSGHIFADDIKELREFKKRYSDSDAHIAQILVRHVADQSHYYLIDVGSRQGIAPDMVAVYKNCLVGKVEQVYPWYSKVCLITDKSCKVAAYCAQTRAHGIHQGLNGLEATTLSYVSHLQKVKKDELILSSGEGLVFPQGFALGRIESIDSDSLHQKITVKSLIDFMSIKYCAIISKSSLK